MKIVVFFRKCFGFYVKIIVKIQVLWSKCVKMLVFRKYFSFEVKEIIAPVKTDDSFGW